MPSGVTFTDGRCSLSQDTDLLRAQSDPYRRMSANLYETKDSGKFYHIHGSLEASTTLRMLGLEPFRADLNGNHDAIVETIETAVRKYTVEELEVMNGRHRQAGVPALTHAEFLCTPHVGPGHVYLPLILSVFARLMDASVRFREKKI